NAIQDGIVAEIKPRPDPDNLRSPFEQVVFGEEVRFCRFRNETECLALLNRGALKAPVQGHPLNVGVRQERDNVYYSSRLMAIPMIKDYSLVCAWRRSKRERLHNEVLDTDTTRRMYPPRMQWNFVNALFQTICPILYHWLKGPDAFIRG